MADVVFNPISGIPPNVGQRMHDCGDNTYALVSLGLAGLLPVQSLSSVSATGPGASLDNTGVRNNHCLVVVSSAGVSAGTVVLQGSQDGTNWFNFSPTVSVSTTTANNVYPPATASLTPVRYLRANITVAITGGTISAWVASAG